MNLSLFGKRIRLFRPRSIWLRCVVQVFFFLLVGLIAIKHTLVENGGGLSLVITA